MTGPTGPQWQVGGPENGALTGINEDLGWPPYPVQFNNPKDKDRDGL